MNNVDAARLVLTLVAGYVFWIWLWRDYAADVLRADMLSVAESLEAALAGIESKSGATRRATVQLARRIDSTYSLAGCLGFWRMVSVVAGAKVLRIDMDAVAGSPGELDSAIAGVRDQGTRESLEKVLADYRRAIVMFYLKTSLFLMFLMVGAIVSAVVAALFDAGAGWVKAKVILKRDGVTPAVLGFVRLGFASIQRRLAGKVEWVDRDTQTFLAV